MTQEQSSRRGKRARRRTDRDDDDDHSSGAVLRAIESPVPSTDATWSRRKPQIIKRRADRAGRGKIEPPTDSMSEDEGKSEPDDENEDEANAAAAANEVAFLQRPR
ncbi:hypothetical protein E2P81_ATG09566 [Venturia nashicola]|nr:hypothetical protein E2P81_ATG09566 [Venturia nashicola]